MGVASSEGLGLTFATVERLGAKTTAGAGTDEQYSRNCRQQGNSTHVAEWICLHGSKKGTAAWCSCLASWGKGLARNVLAILIVVALSWESKGHLDHQANGEQEWNDKRDLKRNPVSSCCLIAEA